MFNIPQIEYSREERPDPAEIVDLLIFIIMYNLSNIQSFHKEKNSFLSSHLHPLMSHFPSLYHFLLLITPSITPPLSLIFLLSPSSFLARLSSTASVSDSLFGPPLESAFKSKSFDGREHLREQSAFGASECKSCY